jgi:hypothetical protein
MVGVLLGEVVHHPAGVDDQLLGEAERRPNLAAG